MPESISKKKSKSHLNRHLTKGKLIKKYEKLWDFGKFYAEKFVLLRTEYCNLKDKLNAAKENNRELASRNAALLHEVEVTRSHLTKFTKDQLIKISGAEKDFDALRTELAKTLANVISKHDPFFVLKQDFEKPLSVGDITQLDSITTIRNSMASSLADDQRHQDRVKENINNIILERIDSTAILEEASPISSGQNAESTNFAPLKCDADLGNSSSHLNFTTLLEPSTKSIMTETSYRRIVPKSPHLNGSNNPIDGSSLTGEDSGWEYNSDFIRIPSYEPVFSTSLDSIQNFIPKTPLLTPHSANQTSTRDSTIISNNSTHKSFFNCLSVAFPEKTPDQSPITSFGALGRSSRRLINTASTSRESTSSSFDVSAPIESRVTSTSTSSTSATRATTPTARLSTRTTTRTFNETKSEALQNDGSNDKNLIFSKNDSETELIADNETQGFRRSKRKRRKVCYREK